MAYSALGFAVTCFLQARAGSKSLTMLFLADFVDGMSSCMNNVCQAYVTDTSAPELRAKNLGVFMGVSVAGAFYGVLAIWVSISDVFYVVLTSWVSVTGLLCAVLAICVFVSATFYNVLAILVAVSAVLYCVLAIWVSVSAVFCGVLAIWVEGRVFRILGIGKFEFPVTFGSPLFATSG